MRTIWAMARKDILLALRDRAGFFFTFVFPIVMAVFFGKVFSSGAGDSAMNIVLVDQDGSAVSKAFTEKLSKSDAVKLTTSADLAAAEQLVRAGKQAAVITLPKGFGDGMDRMFAGKSSEIQVGIDPSRKAEAGMLQGVLMQHAFEGMQSMFTDTSVLRSQLAKSRESLNSDSDTPGDVRGVLDRLFTNLDQFSKDLDVATADDEPATGTATATDGAGFSPIKVVSREITAERRGPPNPFAVTFPQGIVWGLIACCLTFAVSLVLERTRGTLIRLRAAPIGPSRLLAGKALACFLTCCAMVSLLLAMAHLIFGVQFSSVPLLIAAIASMAVCFVGIMMIVAAVSKTEAAANGLGWGILMIASMFGGGMIPVFMLKGWMQTVSNFSPIKWAVYAMEGAIWRGLTPAEMLMPCGILVTIGVVGFLTGALLFRRGAAVS